MHATCRGARRRPCRLQGGTSSHSLYTLPQGRQSAKPRSKRRHWTSRLRVALQKKGNCAVVQTLSPVAAAPESVAAGSRYVQMQTLRSRSAAGRARRNAQQRRLALQHPWVAVREATLRSLLCDRPVSDPRPERCSLCATGSATVAQYVATGAPSWYTRARAKARGKMPLGSTGSAAAATPAFGTLCKDSRTTVS